MINRIIGKVLDIKNSIVTVLVGGIGFELNVSLQTQENLMLGDEICLFSYLSVKEDSITLFGFSTEEEKEMFLKLISISGIGPKMAISILSNSTPESLALAIISGNISVLSNIKGVGKKTAERIILELKEKVNETIKNLDSAEKVDNKLLWQEAEDAIYGLRALGIKEIEARRIVESVAQKGETAEQIITKSLKGLAK